ncbi:MAG: glycosyltransferase, partial [uncultured bacterium]
IDSEKENEVEKVFKNSHFYKFNFKKYVGGNFFLKLYKDLIEPFKLYALHKRIAKEIDAGGFDFIFVHPSQFTHAPFLLRFLKTPHLYFCQEPLRIAHDPIVEVPKNINLIKKIYEIFIRNLRKEIDSSNISYAKVVITNCNYSRDNIKKAYGIKAWVCYLGVDPSVFKPLDMEKEYDLIFVGDTIWMEGFDTLQKIVDLFGKNLKVKIVKPEKGKHITDTELAREYNKAKVLVVLGRFDPFSMIPWEGMSCGVVPVVVNEGGPIEAVKNGKTGYLVDRNANEMKKIVEKLLNQGDLRKKIGKAGRDDVLSYWNWEKSSERVIKIAKETLKL